MSFDIFLLFNPAEDTGFECRTLCVIIDETAQSSLLGARIVEEITSP